MVRTTKSVAEKRLGNIEQEKRFWCRDGREFMNLQELEAAFREMSDDTFRCHCNETKSDFSNWVRDVIGDEKLSKDLAKCTGPSQAAKIVADRIAWLKNKIATG